jgi:hypothetical protein
MSSSDNPLSIAGNIIAEFLSQEDDFLLKKLIYSLKNYE